MLQDTLKPNFKFPFKALFQNPPSNYTSTTKTPAFSTWNAPSCSKVPHNWGRAYRERTIVSLWLCSLPLSFATSFWAQLILCLIHSECYLGRKQLFFFLGYLCQHSLLPSRKRVMEHSTWGIQQRGEASYQSASIKCYDAYEPHLLTFFKY